MTLKKNIGEAGNPKIEKYVSKLKEPARRAKLCLQDGLTKSVKRFQDEADKSISEKEKFVFFKKKEKISKDLDMLKVLSEDEIIRYALLTSKKIMPIASNPRIPREVRMKARVAAHKPLSTHIARLKQKLISDPQSASESESESEEDKESLNKITFNNTIVLMRKDVKRAKVHIIHKLTRNIKKFRAAKGKDDKVAKNQRKAERLHNKVIHIKELLEDDVSKFALSTTQDPSKLANDIKIPMTSQALATVAINQFVVPHVMDFRKKYPDWQKMLPNLLKKKKKKRKLNLETKSNKKNSFESTQANTEEDSHSESENEEENGSDNCEKSGSEDIEESGSENAEESGSEEEEEDPDNENYETSLNENDEDISDSDDEIVSSSVNDEISTVKSKTTVSKKINKNKEQMKETSLNSLHVVAKPVEDKPKVIDPFFVTSTNEEYTTSQVPISSGENLSSNKMEHFGSNKTGKFSSFDNQKMWEKTDNDWKHRRFNRSQESAPYRGQGTGSFDKYSRSTKMDKLVFGNRKERRKALKQPEVEEKVEKLHPSWEAKKKQSSIIPFQGKKVTFD